MNATLRFTTGVQRIPTRALVRVDSRQVADLIAHEQNRVPLNADDEGSIMTMVPLSVANASNMMVSVIKEDAMPESGKWEVKAKAMLKAELKRRNVTYAQLVDKLSAIGVRETEPNVRNKLARGKFTAVFMLQCLEAIGAQSLRLSDS